MTIYTASDRGGVLCEVEAYDLDSARRKVKKVMGWNRIPQSIHISEKVEIEPEANSQDL